MKKHIILSAILIVALTGCTKKAGLTAPNQETSTQPQTEFTLMQDGVSKGAPVPSTPTQQATTAVTTESATAASSATTTEPTAQEIQQALHNANLYSGKIDGSLGPRTKKAIKDFQEQNGLKADGKIGKKTWVKLQPFLTKEAQTEPTVSKD